MARVAQVALERLGRRSQLVARLDALRDVAGLIPALVVVDARDHARWPFWESGDCISDSSSDKLAPPVTRTCGVSANVTDGSTVSRVR